MKNSSTIDSVVAPIARLYVNDLPESMTAYRNLTSAGFTVYTFPINGLPWPELKIGQTLYQGLASIDDLINSHRSPLKHK